MRRTRAVTLTALVAASAMVFAACSSSPGQAAPSSTASTPASAGSSASAPSGSSSAAASAPAGTAAGTPASTAPTGSGASNTGTNGCGTPHGPYTDPGAAKGTITTGLDELVSSWNNESTHGNSVYNTNPAYLTQAQIYYYDSKLNVVNNDSFVKCTVVTKSPLTVKYTINKAAKWSDGVPITADDLMLQWIAKSGKYSTGKLKTDADGNITGATGVAFDISDPGAALITQIPTISADRSTLTVVFSKPFVDYQIDPFGPALIPAHVVGEKALGISDPTKAVEAIYTAAQKSDTASLAKIANFWNTGFDFTQLPTDKSLYLSNGAYLLTAFKKDQYMTFTANPDYTWGPKPTIKTITWEYLPDATAAVQSMQNQEVAVIEPQHPTTDLTKGLGALSDQGIKTVNSVSGSASTST